ncbi:MAG: hypothetical protein KIT09_24145 [Bryobacteraceae bacterium]|nr:hypothetical protein [Bryobacteraceae bacterium]
MRPFLILLAAAAVVCGQRPVISPGGVVNAASYATGGLSRKAVAIGSIVSVFGSNLATVTQSADSLPLPANLGGTSVTVNGVPAPLFFVSPNQINLQLPSRYPPPFWEAEMVVTTPAGMSDPYPLDLDNGEGFGIFTLDSSGCGRGAVFNVAADGSVSLNSPFSSASPGDYLGVYGTGLIGFYNPPADGAPAPSDPPSLALNWSTYLALFELPSTLLPPTPFTKVSWAGRAPGFVGLDQVNLRIPDTVREGCGVPLMISTNGRSQPVPISIRKGGGACLDPPTAAYGVITWERTEASGMEPAGATETFTASFDASPGKQPPPPVEFREGSGRTRAIDLFGPVCPLPGYTSLEAGTVSFQGPGFGPAEAAPVMVEGRRVYRAVLPNGTIRPGSFTVTAGGGAGVGAFQSSLRIGSGINVTSSFPPGTIVSTHGPLLTVNWTGGDPDAWVTLKLVNHFGVLDIYNSTQARASSGAATVDPSSLPPRPAETAEIILEVTPDPAQIPALSATGLSLGGQHVWKYTYRFGGLTLQ